MNDEQNNDAEARKREVLQWLKSIKQDREWLGKQIGSQKRTLDNWFSTKGSIPDSKYDSIRKLMFGPEPVSLNYDSVEVITARLTSEEYASVLACCKADGFGDDLEAWLRACILEHVQDVLAESHHAAPHSSGQKDASGL